MPGPPDPSAGRRVPDRRQQAHRLLAQQLKDLSLIGLDFSPELTDFEMVEIDLRILSLDDTPEPGDDPADALSDTNAFATLMGEERAAMVFTDPPYNVPIDRRIQFRQPMPAIPRPVGRRSGQDRVVQTLSRQRPERFDRIVQSWDTANKATELSDFSVCTTWGVKGKHLFLIGLCRRRLEYPALKRAVREQQDLFNASVVLIEDKASGTQLIQDLIAEGCHGVTRYQPTDEKTMRMHAQTAVIENGFVHIPETAPWLAEYLHELAVFPNGKHDDQADSTAQFLDWFKRPFPSQGIFELHRMNAERRQRRTRSWVRLQAPPGIGSVQTLHSRQHLTVGLDGTVEMWAADAQYFIRDGWTKLAEWTTEEDATAERSKPQTMPQPGSMEWLDTQKKKG